MRERPPPSLLPWFVWKRNLSAIQPAGEVDQRPTSRATTIHHERLLAGNGLFGRPVVIGNHGRGWNPEGPFDLGTRVVVTSVVPIDHEGDALRVDSQLPRQESQSGAGLPEAEWISAGHQQHLPGAF